MYCNSTVWLYLKSNEYKKVQYPCAVFNTVNNNFSESGNYISKLTKIFIPLSWMAPGEDIQVNANTDYAYIGDNPVDLTTNEDGELDPTPLLKIGGKVITASSKKDYGSSHMQHYYIQCE